MSIDSPLRYDTNDDGNWRELLTGSGTEDGSPQWLPRRTVCGSREARRWGLTPITDRPDILVDPKDYERVIERCHERKVFPYYHQLNSGVLDDGWNQDGYGYCWAYGMAMSLMDCRAVERQPPVRLAPFSLGWLVNWRNAGYYLDATIKGARDRGIASAEFVPEYNLRPSTFKAGWEQDALNYRATEWWDTPYVSDRETIQYLVTILATGRPGYVAFNWWSHALEVCAVNYNSGVANDVEVVLRNSHGETDPIILTGARSVPDELYGVRASSHPT